MSGAAKGGGGGEGRRGGEDANANALYYPSPPPVEEADDADEAGKEEHEGEADATLSHPTPTPTTQSTRPPMTPCRLSGRACRSRGAPTACQWSCHLPWGSASLPPSLRPLLMSSLGTCLVLCVLCLILSASVSAVMTSNFNPFSEAAWSQSSLEAKTDNFFAWCCSRLGCQFLSRSDSACESWLLH